MTNLRRRLCAVAAAVLLGTGAATAVGNPAQAWSYCSTTGRNYVNYLNGYNSQGYCGGWEVLGYVPGTCVNLTTGTIPPNWMGAVWNRTLWGVILYERPDCNGANGPTQYIAPNTSDPDLYYPTFLFRNVSSVFWGS